MRRIRVKLLTTNNLQLSGDITLTMLPDSYRSKISDLLNNSRNFIALTDVEVHGNDEEVLAKMPYLCINKPALALVFEDESLHASADETNKSKAHCTPHRFRQRIFTGL